MASLVLAASLLVGGAAWATPGLVGREGRDILAVAALAAGGGLVLALVLRLHRSARVAVSRERQL